MEEYQQRVVEEKQALDEKIAKLETFIDEGMGSIFRNLPVDERSRLVRQHDVMHEYSQVLGERIAAFK